MKPADNKTFCMMPWVHLHVSPTGKAAPCCISRSITTLEGMGNTKNQSLMELVNSAQMNKLRLDMLAGIKNEECSICYKQEEMNVVSHRQNTEFDHYYNDVVSKTNVDGSLSEFKMRYFDIRFSNICNFKCRSCGDAFSSQWEQENLKNKVSYARIIPKNNNKQFLTEILDQVRLHVDSAYFAGGEPLITEEHYVILEEMIRAKRTDISLIYNTNLSTLNFKNKDLFSLWKHFKNINVYASIDHYGKRAEYIRHGTDWSMIENNFALVKKQSNVSLQINTVLSIFNLLTFHDFYRYLLDRDMFNLVKTSSVYLATGPKHISSLILPAKYKELGKSSLNQTIAFLESTLFNQDQISQLRKCIPSLELPDEWDQGKYAFREEISRLDKIRGEDFAKTFPELAGLLDE